MDIDLIELNAHEAWENNNLILAFELFSECAHQNHIDSMLSLGYFYDEGIGTVANKKLAMYWYKKAYQRGNSAAASNIAILYREQQRFKHAFQWFQRSAKLDDGDAEVELAKLCISGQGIRKSFNRATKYLRNALNSTHITPVGIEEAETLLLSFPKNLI